MNPTPSKERDPLIDIMRGIAMLLVIFCHASEMFFNPDIRSDGAFDSIAYEVWRIIYAFHMPAFYFISGMTALQLARKPFRSAASHGLSLIAFAFATQILFGTVIMLAAKHIGPVQVLLADVRILFEGTLFTLMVTWFLVSLGIVHVLAWAFLRHGPRTKLAVVVVAALAWTAGEHFNRNYLQVMTWLPGLMFFLIGYLTAKHVTAPKRSWGLAVGVVVTFGVVIALYHSNNGCLLDPGKTCNQIYTRGFGVLMVLGQYGFLPFFFLTATAGTFAIYFLALLLRRRGGVVGNAFSFVGRRTLSLLVINGTVLSSVEPMVAPYIRDSTLNWLLSAGALVTAQCLLLPLLEPVLSRLYAACQQASAWLVTQAVTLAKRPVAWRQVE